MGAVKDIATTGVAYGGELDGVVIVQLEKALTGGRTLDTTGYTPEAIKAGHVIIRETATGNYKPMPVSGAAYAALPAGHTYEGIAGASIPTSKPFASVMVGGIANEVAVPYPITSIKAAFVAAVPHIYWTSDNK